MYVCLANMRFMLSRSLSCLDCPCSDFICHAVVSGVRKQPGGGTQCPRITSSDCSGHPELCPGDRAKPAVRHPSVPPGPHGIPGTDCALASSQSASRLIDLALLLESEPGLWIIPPPGIYRPYPRLVRHIGMPLVTALLVAVQSQCWIGCHRQDLLLPYPLAVDANQDRHRLPHLIRIRMVQHLARWFMDLGRKKDEDSRPSCKTIARFLQKPIEEVKQAWKVYQQLEARA